MTLNVVIGDACRATDAAEFGESHTNVTTARSIVDIFTESTAHVLIRYCRSFLTRSQEWINPLLPHIRRPGCTWVEANLSTTQVGIPCNRLRTYIVCAREVHRTREKFAGWKEKLELLPDQKITLGEFLGKQGDYLLKRNQVRRLSSHLRV